MAALAGTNVSAKVVPFDSADTYATHDEKYGRGGYRVVANLTERDSISTPRRVDGMLVFVTSEDKTYQLYGGISNSNWRIYSIGSSISGSSYVYGTVFCDINNYVYQVNNSSILPNSIINVTVKVPSISSVHYNCSLAEVTSGSFKIVLSDVPEVSGYSINWLANLPL